MMNKFKYLCGVLVFSLFIPKVYAFTFDVNTLVSNTSVEAGTLTEIRVSLGNVQGTEYGVASCSLNIEFDKGIMLDSKIRTLGSWTMTTGKFYLFDTGEPIKNNGDLFIIPVRVNEAGSVKLVDITCSDDETMVELNDKRINFTIGDSITDDGDNDGDSEVETVKDSNCDLSMIELSEGTIEFDSAVTEYDLKVSNFNDLDVTPKLASDKASFSMKKMDNKYIVINVMAEDGTSKVYTLYVEEVSLGELNRTKKTDSKFKYIFIGIIAVLILINIIRIVKNRKK